MAETYRLYLLGGFRLEKKEREIVLPRAKVKTLLAYLALHPQEHSRETLAALLWGDVTDEQARASLRVALNALRKEIHPDLLLTDRETAQLNPAFPLWTDAKEIFDLRFMISDLQNADSQQIINRQSKIINYPGDLLAGFYDEWIEPEREKIRDEYIAVLLRAVEHFRGASDYANAVTYANRVLEIDRANETAHQHLIFLYAAQGDRVGALKQFDECVRALDEELGVEPSPETIALAKQINKKPTAKSDAAAQTNLPKPLTSFVGREIEIREITELIAQRSQLVTLLGPGGSGKTRLAIQLGRALLDDFRDGVWWVELAPLTDPLLVPQAVAKALGVQEEPNTPLTDTLTAFLRERELLLILDNCEHLIDACAHITNDLITQSLNLSILATSREGLNIAGEQLYPVAPLDLPRAAIASFAEQALEFSAVRLFVERARLADLRFELNEANVLPIVQICTRLDGIPLAIELAAARVRQMSVSDIAARLDSRFELLVGARTADPRQQTLRALIDWSYSLLADDERALFRQLTVFSGGWTLEAGEKVSRVQVSSVTMTHDTSTLDTLARLVDKSLVVADTSAEETRYRMLETVREYAREKLNEAGKLQDARTRHLDYFVDFVEQAAANFWGRAALGAFERVESEHDNLRAALRFALDSGDVARTVQLAGALGGFWHQRNYVDEGERWYAEILALPLEQATLITRARLFKNAGTLAWAKADYARARELHERALALYQALDDKAGISLSLNNIATQYAHLGERERAATLNLQALEAARATNDMRARVYALHNCGYGAMEGNDFERAEMYFTEALHLSQRDGDLLSTIATAGNLGELARMRGDSASARTMLEHTIAASRAYGNDHILQVQLREYGSVLALLREFTNARAVLWEAWELAEKDGDLWTMGGTFSRLAHLEAMQERYQNAVQIWSHAFALLAQIPDAVLPPAIQQVVESYLDLARAALGEERYEREWQRGQLLTNAQALALVYGDALSDEF